MATKWTRLNSKSILLKTQCKCSLSAQANTNAQMHVCTQPCKDSVVDMQRAHTHTDLPENSKTLQGSKVKKKLNEAHLERSSYLLQCRRRNPYPWVDSRKTRDLLLLLLSNYFLFISYKTLFSWLSPVCTHMEMYCSSVNRGCARLHAWNFKNRF